MKAEEYSDYVSYNVEKYYSVKPEGPITCPMCNGDLSESAIEPSKAMSKEIAGPDYDYGSSLMFICNQCHWWCIREHYEFVDGGAARRYGCDYLIFSTAKSSKSKVIRNLPVEHTQPWLKALEDPKVYDKVQAFPEKLAVLFKGGVTWKKYK
jgi:hypothetical protein